MTEANLSNYMQEYSSKPVNTLWWQSLSGFLPKKKKKKKKSSQTVHAGKSANNMLIMFIWGVILMSWSSSWLRVPKWTCISTRCQWKKCWCVVWMIFHCVSLVCRVTVLLSSGRTATVLPPLTKVNGVRQTEWNRKGNAPKPNPTYLKANPNPYFNLFSLFHYIWLLFCLYT